jgi:uncharacterized repeat protein (TIGR01451 family)
MRNVPERSPGRWAARLIGALVASFLLVGAASHAAAVSPIDCALVENSSYEACVTVIVTKYVDGPALEDPEFAFSAVSGESEPQSFGPLGDGDSATIQLPPGQITVSETPVEGYQAAFSGCYRDSFGPSSQDGTAIETENGDVYDPARYTFQAAAGETWRCDFVNVKRPRLIVTKTVTGAAAGDPTPFTFSLTDIGGRSEDQSIAVAAPDPVLTFDLANGGAKTIQLDLSRNKKRGGGYEITEMPVPAGYAFGALSCTRTDPLRDESSESEYESPGTVLVPTLGPTARLENLLPGTVVECDYTNVKLPKLTVTKTLTNGSGAGLATPFPFTITGQPAFSLAGGQSDGPRILPVGSYTITEGTVPAGFTLTGVVCSEPSPVNGQSVEVNLAAGDDVTCTFTNNQTPPPAVVTQALKPRLAIVKTGPLRARPLQRFNYTIRVRNRGRAVARGVVVTDRLPLGLTYVRASRRATVKGRTVNVAMGDLRPGQARTVRISVRAASDVRGPKVNLAVARANNARPVRDTARTVFRPLVRRVIPVVTG